MTSRIHLIAALLSAAAALTGTAAMASDAVEGNRGPADKSQDRNAPLSLPGKLVPRATPHVEVATLGRGLFDEDQATALANLGTVTLGADGKVIETPASEDLRGVLESAVKGHRSGK